MTETSLNLFDLGVLIVVGLSALLAFYRGFVSEVLSLGGWLVASLVTLRFLEPATGLVKPHIKSEAIASGVAAVGLFFLTLILFSIITSIILKVLKPGEKVGLLDNLAGLTFGVARGTLIVAIAYFIMTKFFTDEKNYPKIVQHAVTRPYVAKCAKWIGTLTPDYLDKVIDKENDSKKVGASDDEDIDHNKPGLRDMIERMERKPDPALTKNMEALTGKKSGDGAPDSSLPSIEDLQQRIKEENEKR